MKIFGHATTTSDLRVFPPPQPSVSTVNTRQPSRTAAAAAAAAAYERRRGQPITSRHTAVPHRRRLDAPVRRRLCPVRPDPVRRRANRPDGRRTFRRRPRRDARAQRSCLSDNARGPGRTYFSGSTHAQIRVEIYRFLHIIRFNHLHTHNRSSDIHFCSFEFRTAVVRAD